jgi:tetratricopeptide (TPR) repeat protein
MVLSLSAQDADKDMKKAGRLIGTYNLDPAGNADKLAEAKSLIDAAMSTGDLDGVSKAWATQASIYAELMNKDIQQIVLNPEAELANPDAPLIAFNGYRKALETAEKKFETKDALTGITMILQNVNYMGSIAYQRQDFGRAYKLFNSTVMADRLLKENGEERFFTDDNQMMEQKYYAGIAALSGEMMPEAEALFQELYTANYDNPAVYEALYKVRHDKDMAGAEKILKEGRAKFPDDVGLLYSEINFMLEKGRLDELIGSLEMALEKEPGNLSVITTLGNVNDQLYQRAMKDGNEEKAAGYFENALKYFEKALDQDPDYFDAIYSIGQLYYNKAAQLTQEMNALADDYSKEGTAKYEVKKKESDEMFEKALPYFQKAEKINDKDMNTLIALKEIFARKNDFEKSNEYKERIDALNE